MKEEEKKKDVQMCIMGATHMPMWDVQFEDNENPSEKGLGFVINVAAADEKMARWMFGKAEPNCTIKEMEEVDHVIVPIMSKDSNEITLNQYQAAAMTTCMPTSNNDAYMLTNLVGEVGELSSKIAKAIRKGKMYFDTSNELAFMPKTTDEEAAEIMEGIKGELGDVLWQLSGLCSTMGYDLQEVAEYNLEKLAARKKAGTIDGNGDGVSGKERTK